MDKKPLRVKLFALFTDDLLGSPVTDLVLRLGLYEHVHETDHKLFYERLAIDVNVLFRKNLTKVKEEHMSYSIFMNMFIKSLAGLRILSPAN